MINLEMYMKNKKISYTKIEILFLLENFYKKLISLTVKVQYSVYKF